MFYAQGWKLREMVVPIRVAVLTQTWCFLSVHTNGDLSDTPPNPSVFIFISRPLRHLWSPHRAAIRVNGAVKE